MYARRLYHTALTLKVMGMEAWKHDENKLDARTPERSAQRIIRRIAMSWWDCWKLVRSDCKLL